jgi:hypothetical protein
LWLKAVSAFREGRCDDAVYAIKKIEAVSPLLPDQLAFLAQVYIFDGRSDEARPYLVRARDDASNYPNEYGKYVNLYSRVLLSLLDNGEPVDPLIEASRTVKCRAAIKRWLPLYK